MNTNPPAPKEPFVWKTRSNSFTPYKTPNQSEEKCSDVDDLKKKKANISIYDMLQHCLTQKEALLKYLGNTIGVSVGPAQKDKGKVLDTFDAMETIFKGKIGIPTFLLTICMFGKYVHNCLVVFEASCNIISYSICQELGITLIATNRVVV